MSERDAAPTFLAVLGWAALLVLLSFMVSVDLGELFDSAPVYIDLYLSWAAPVAGVAIGLSLKRRALWPFILAAPLCLPEISVSLFDDALFIASGHLPGLYIAGAMAALAFGRDIDPDAPLRQPAGPFAGGALLAVLMLILAVTARIRVDISDSLSAALVARDELPVLATFALAVSGRLNFRGLMVGLGGFVLVVLAAKAGWHIFFAGDSAAAEHALDRLADVTQFEREFDLSDILLFVDGSIGWPGPWTTHLIYGLAAGCVGLVFAPAWQRRETPGSGTNWVFLLALAAATVLAGPTLNYAGYELSWHLPDMFTASAATMPLPAAQDVVTVTAVSWREINLYLPVINAISLAILAGIAACIAARSPSRSGWLWPVILLGVATIFARHVNDMISHRWNGWDYVLPQVLFDLLTVLPVLLIAAAAGRSLARRFGWAGLEPITWPGLPDDITRLAEAARRLDVSATLRAFTFLAAILISWWQVVAGGFVYMQMKDIIDADGSGWFTPLVAVSLIAGLVTPFAFMMVDTMARQPLRGLSAGIAILNMLLLLFWGLMILAVLFVLAAFAAHLAGLDIFEDADFSDSSGWMDVLAMSVVGASGFWLSMRTIRVERSLASPVPRGVLLGTIGRRGFLRHLAYIFGLPSSMWRAGALLQPSSWLFLVSRPMVYAAVLVGGLALQSYQAYDYDSWGYEEEVTRYAIAPHAGLYLAAGGAIFLLAHVAFAAAKRLAARRIWSAEADGKTGRSPTLFLRSFEDDQLDFRRSWLNLPGKWLDLWAFRRNVDELLIDEFAQFGPIVALGKPGETRRKFGAQRRFATHETWQAVIRDTAERSQAIVVAAGETPGLLWEYNLIGTEAYFAKTIYLIPPPHRDGTNVRRALNVLHDAYPDTPLPESRPGLHLVALVWDAESWHPVFSKRATAQAYLVVLREFFQELGISNGPTTSRPTS